MQVTTNSSKALIHVITFRQSTIIDGAASSGIEKAVPYLSLGLDRNTVVCKCAMWCYPWLPRATCFSLLRGRAPSDSTSVCPRLGSSLVTGDQWCIKPGTHRYLSPVQSSGLEFEKDLLYSDRWRRMTTGSLRNESVTITRGGERCSQEAMPMEISTAILVHTVATKCSMWAPSRTLQSRVLFIALGGLFPYRRTSVRPHATPCSPRPWEYIVSRLLPPSSEPSSYPPPTFLLPLLHHHPSSALLYVRPD